MLRVDQLLASVVIIALVAVLVSGNSTTTNFLTSAFSSMTALIKMIMKPAAMTPGK